MTNNKSQFLDETEDKVEYPYCQILNDRKEFGLFVPVGEAHKAGFQRDYLNTDNVIDHFTAANNKLTGILFQKPGISIVRETPLLMRVRSETNTTGRLYLFDNDFYQANKTQSVLDAYGKRKSRVETLQRWLIYLYDQNNELLHDRPLLLSLGARMSVELGKNAWNRLRNQFNKYFWGDMSRMGKPKFNSLILFMPKFGVGMVGQVEKSLGCTVLGYQDINEANHEDYFLGFDDDTKSFLYEAFDKNEEFVKFPDINTGNVQAPGQGPDNTGTTNFYKNATRQKSLLDINQELIDDTGIPF